MKKILSVLFLPLLLGSNLAQASGEKTKIRQIREWTESTSKELTCGDEYFKRRKQLGLKIGLAPVIIAGSGVTGFVGGAFLGISLFRLSGAPTVGFADLAALVGGAFLGSVTSLGISTTQEGIAVANFFRNQNLLRLIYESHQEGGEALDGFYGEFKSLYPDNNLTKDEFSQEIRELDEKGKLCDGTLVRPRRYKKGRKLKQLLATKSEIFNYLAH
jgi:hypothetical protein